MRLLHTSDWHLGRLFHGQHLTEDQAHVLGQIVQIARDEKVTAIVIAGDVYDRAIPPPEAVELLDEVLTEIATDLAIPVVVIAGNHDSPERLGFASEVLATRGVYTVGRRPKRIVIGDGKSEISLLALPYLEPAYARELFKRPDINTHNDAIAHALQEFALTPAKTTVNVVVAHAFVTGAVESESERPLAVGNTGTVSADLFHPFAYAALGHLHRPQAVGSDRIRYSGSILKYSFSEASHSKSVSIVELDDSSRPTVSINTLELSPRRDVRIVRANFSEILSREISESETSSAFEDYVLVELTDRGAILDAMARIREVYPNCLHIDRSAFLASETSPNTIRLRGKDHRSRSEVELFRDFVSQVEERDLTEAESREFEIVIDEIRATTNTEDLLS